MAERSTSAKSFRSVTKESYVSRRARTHFRASPSRVRGTAARTQFPDGSVKVEVGRGEAAEKITPLEQWRLRHAR